MACFAPITFMIRKMSLKKKSHKIVKPPRYVNLTVETPQFCDLEDVESHTPTGVISFEGPARADTPRVPNFLKLPRTFPILNVQVPTEDEKDSSPDLPAQVFQVFEGLPSASDWGATERMAVKRLEHLRLIDYVAYKKAHAKGLKTPLPPKLRA